MNNNISRREARRVVEPWILVDRYDAVTPLGRKEKRDHRRRLLNRDEMDARRVVESWTQDTLPTKVEVQGQWK